MVETETTAPHSCDDANNLYEKEFRRKSTFRAFMGAVYSAVGGASFIGALGQVAGLLMHTTAVTTGFNVATQAAITVTGMTGIMAASGTLLALVAIGAIAVFLAERQFTELSCLKDEHAARKTAQAMAKEKARAKAEEKSAAAEIDVAPVLSQPTQPDRRFTETIIQRSPAGLVAAGNDIKKGFAETALAAKEAATGAARG